MRNFEVGDKVRFRDDFGSYPAGFVATVVRIDYEGDPVILTPDGIEGFLFHRTLHEQADLVCGSTYNHYTPDASGKDYLARCEETYSRDEMIGAYRFTIGKYVDRMGKKHGEPVEKELDKIIDYATRAKQWLGRQS